MSHAHNPPHPEQLEPGAEEGGLREIVTVWLSLMLLLCATVVAHFLTHATLALLIAFGIAIAKMGLVMAYYMHLKYRPHLVWIFSAAAFLWLAIFFGLSLSDYATRHWILLRP